MTASDRLTAALQDRYGLERDAHGGASLLGQGGMATVYLGDDLLGRRLNPVLGPAPEGVGAPGPEGRFSDSPSADSGLQPAAGS